ncbi:hypothetical protein C5467_11800 [Photorhabdus khanii subsp. guanajuatensis]|uniref:Adhesin n=1 Tax=Photorhabdus khanii subsp. guanajuatensis TaxID=2100166 RepID=A0A4R4JUB9_9GAMM|nr:hemagglutinin repeat-containing protein [Photorhabdus khanii]TDB57119.1 hypothetical protein C5467_11800 [Photorhabdus khanii subsp. guanajuatensis]
MHSNLRVKSRHITTGLNLSASINHGKGRESGDGVSHNETTVDAGQNVTLNAGRDATLKGAQVSGEQITADVKRNLTLTSEQDSNRYDMKVNVRSSHLDKKKRV